ncbi:MAG: Ig-like domain-containing protein [Bifidobacteriaceae bacterium]|jgi:hypothetical protein|nr:Ig-like domain-containing protein [Bifidobacteriaceae bacterium]
MSAVRAQVESRSRKENLKRRARQVVALAAVAATGLGGLVVAQTTMGVSSAEAVNIYAPWDGQFREEYLWHQAANDNLGSTWASAWLDPSWLEPATWRAPEKVAYLAGKVDGAAATHGTITIATGPALYKARGDKTNGMIGIDVTYGKTILFQPDTSSPTPKVDAIAYQPLTKAAVAEGASKTACYQAGAQSAAINQENGYLYASSWGGMELSGTSLVGTAKLGIFELGWQEGATLQPMTCLAGVNEITGAHGKTLNQQWLEATGLRGPNVNWVMSDDVVVDLQGDFYIMMTGGPERHALVRVDVPKKPDGSPDPTNVIWEYTIVKTFTQEANPRATAISGMALMDGALYTIDQSSPSVVRRWDLMTEQVTRLGKMKDSTAKYQDLAGGQAAATVTGTIYNDANGNGVIDRGESGVGGVKVEIWQGDAASGSTSWTKRITVPTDSDGRYSTLLNAKDREYLVRPIRPSIGDAAARQTYASAGRESDDDGLTNLVRPYCSSDAGDYQLHSGSGSCWGARLDGADPESTTNPLDPAAGAGIVTNVEARTAKARIVADFGITTAASWGDAPDGYKTTNAAQGPYANPTRAGRPYLHLGAAAGVYPDGAPGAGADAHSADDGLELAPKGAGGAPDASAWQSAQGQLMASGQTYAFRAKANVPAELNAAARVKAWITAVEGGKAAATMAEPLLGGGGCSAVPDQEGYVQCDYAPRNPSPTGDVTPLYARARVSTDDAMTAVSRGSGSGSAPWVPLGEIEDYRLGLANGVLRLQARSLGGAAANVSLSLDAANISTVAPSSATDTVLTKADGSFQAGASGHALKSLSQGVSITTAAVGAVGATGVNGWRLADRQQGGQSQDSYCFDSLSGARLDAQVDQAAGSLTLAAPAVGVLPADVTCRLTYAPEADYLKSSVTADPSSNQDPADRLTVPLGSSTVSVEALGVVVDADGQEQTRPAAGAEVELALAPLGAEPADGARLESSSDDGASWIAQGQALTCVLDSAGGCDQDVRVIASAPGGYGLSARLAGRHLTNKATGEGTDTSPVEIWFKAGAPASGEIALDDTKDRAANHGQVDPADSYRLDIWVRDGQGNGVTGLADANFTKSCVTGQRSINCPPASGVVFGNVTEDPAEDGHYSVTVGATKAGEKRLAISVAGVSGKLGQKGNPSVKHVTATFTAMAEASAAESSFVITSTEPRIASASNPDDPQRYHLGRVVLKDANGNPISAAKLTWADTEPAAANVEIAESGQAGVYDVKIWSPTPGVFQGKRIAFNSGTASAVILTQAETFVFVADQPDQTASDMEITTTPGQLANRNDPKAKAETWGRQTITVTLADAGGNPYRGAAGRLFASAPAAGVEGVRYADPAGIGEGGFACAAPAGADGCEAGVYQLEVYAARAGAKQITVTFTPEEGEAFDVREKSTGLGHVTALFVTPPAAPGESVFVLGDSKEHQGETDPQDNWDDPADQPDGGDSVAHETSMAFHPGVRVWDAGRNNPIGGARVTLTLTDQADPAAGACPAVFEDNQSRSIELRTSATGKASAAVNSAQAGVCVITATLATNAGQAEVPGSPKVLTWIDSEVDAAASSFTVSADSVVADGRDRGEVSARLVGAGGDPVVQAADTIKASATSDAGLTFSKFKHVSDGVYTATFTGVKSGDKAVTVEVAGEPVAVESGGNGFARMIAGAPAATTSWLVEPGETGRADGLTSLPVKVRAFDALGNPATTGVIEFTIPEGTAATAVGAGVGVTGGGGETGAGAGTGVGLESAPAPVAGPGQVTAPVENGWARIDLTSTKAATHIVTASLAGQAVTVVKDAAEQTQVGADGRAKAVFSAAAASSDQSVLTIPTAGVDGLTTKLVGGAEKHTAEVAVTDANSNPVAAGAAAVVFRWSYTDNQGNPRSDSSQPVATDANGVASYSFGSLSASVWTIEARIVGATKDVQGSPKTAAFAHGELDAHATLGSFTVDSTVKKADGVAWAAAKMRALDQHGNPIKDVDLGFLLDYQTKNGPRFADAATGLKTATALSGDDGWARGRIYSLWPGDFDVKGSLGQVTTTALQVHFSNAAAEPATSSFKVAPAPGNASTEKVVADGVESYIATVTLRDAAGTPLNDAGATVHMTPRNIPGAKESEHNIVSGQLGQGQAQVSLTTSKAGLWDVTVKIGNDLVGTEADSQVKVQTIEFVAGPPSVDGADSRLIAPVRSAKADGQETQVVRAEIRDAFGNPVLGQAVVFAVPADTKIKLEDGSLVAGPTFETVTADGAGGLPAGVAELALVSTKTGQRAVTATVAGEDIRAGSPAQVTFVNADLSAARSEFDIPTATSSKTVVTEFHTPRVTLRDASGNLYTPAALVQFHYRLSGAADWQAGPAVTAKDGVALWKDFTVSVAGVYEVRASLTVGQVPDSDTTRQATFRAGPANAANSSLTTSSGSVLPNGKDTHSATVTVRDALGNPVTGETVSFGLADSGPAFFVGACQEHSCALKTSDKGQATALVASSASVTAQVTAALTSGPIASAGLLFAAGAPDAAKSSWTIAPQTAQVADGKPAFTASVQVNDANGLGKADARVDFDVPTAVAITEPGPYQTDGQGRLTVHLTATAAGVYTVNALLGATPIPEADQSIIFTAGAISGAAGDTYLTAPASPATADGASQQVVTATVRDVFLNPVADAAVRFAVPDGTSLAGGGKAEVKTDARGQARLALVSTRAGGYDVTAEARLGEADSWTAITGGSPARVVFTAGTASLTESWLSKDQDGPLTADGAAHYTLSVSLKDKHGNPVKVADTAVEVTLRLIGAGGAPVAGLPAEVKHLATDADGVAQVEFATTRAGLWRAQATIGAGQITGGSPLQLAFEAGAPTAASSRLQTTGNTVLANGAAEHSAWVIVRDANSNPVAGQAVQFVIDQGADGVAGPTLAPADGLVTSCDAAADDAPEWCDQDGLALVTITSKEPGSFNVSATLGGDAVADSPGQVSFDAGWPDKGKSQWTLSPDTVASPGVSVTASGDPADSYTLRATVRSASGILVPDARLRLTGLDTDNVSIVEAGGVDGVTGQPTSGNYGFHIWRLYSAKAGVYTGVVEVNTGGGRWAVIDPEPFTLRFGAGAGLAGESWLIAPGGASTVGGDGLKVRAHLRDANQNDIEAGSAVFTVPDGLTAVVGGSEVVGGDGVTVAAAISAGYAAVEYKTVRAGVYTVGASVGGSGILVVKDAEEKKVVGGDGRVSLKFVAGAAVAGSSVLSVPTARGGVAKVADGRAEHRAEVLVKDQHGNAKAGVSVMFRRALAGGAVVEQTATSGLDGIAVLEFASSQAGTVTVRAYVAGAEVSDSPQTARFVAGEFDGSVTLASFEVQSTTALATGTQELWARMRATDALGNPIKGVRLGFRVAVGGDGPVFTPLADGRKEVWEVSGDDGWARVHLVSEFEGVFPVVGLLETVVGGVTEVSESAPQKVKFANDAADPVRSWFTVSRDPGNQGDPATADGRDSYRVVVSLRNASGDPLNGVSAEVKVKGPGRSSSHTVTSERVDGVSGTATYELTSLKSGRFAVSVELGGDRLSVDGADADADEAFAVFVAGAASEGQSRLVGPETGSAKADGREQQVIKAQVRDANDNPVVDAEVEFDVPGLVTCVDPSGVGRVDGPDRVVARTDAAGVAVLPLVSKTRGRYEVTAKVGGESITQGSPAVAVFTNADVSAGRSEFTIPTAGEAKTVRSEFHTPTVALFDASGNSFVDEIVSVVFRWRLVGASSWAGSRTVASADGVAVWSDWTVGVAGVYEVAAFISSGQVGGELSARFKAGPAVASASQFTSSAGTRVLNDGVAAHFAEVLVVDAAVAGNPVPAADVEFTVTGGAKFANGVGQGLQTVSVKTSDLGVARVEIVDAVSGGETVTVTAVVAGEQVGTAGLEFGPDAPDAARSSWAVGATTAIGGSHPAVLADGADSWTASVLVKDKNGQAVANTEVKFDLPGALRAGEPGPYRTDASGRVAVTLVSEKSGSYRVRALLGAEAIAPGVLSVDFASGAVDSLVSALEGPGATALADGKASLVVRARVLDAKSNPVLGAKVAFDVPEGLTVVGGVDGPAEHVVEAGAGVAELEVVSTTAAVYEVTARAQGPGVGGWEPIELNSPALVEFTAGPVDTTTSRISRSPDGPLVAGAEDGYEVLVELVDAHGNPVKQSGLAVQYAFFLGGQVGDPEAFCRQAADANTQYRSAFTDAAGQARVPFTSTRAGAWRGCAFYAGDRIVSGSPVDLSFDPAGADTRWSVLEVSTNLVLADGSAAHYAKAVVSDQHGNPIGGVKVDFGIDPGVDSIAGPSVKGSDETTASVTTCDPADKADAAAYCESGGVFQAGLALVEFTSLEPGAFAVSASVDGGEVAGSPSYVSFSAGPADASKANWRLDPDTADPVGGASVSVPATGGPGDVYKLDLWVRSGSGLLVPDARVRLTGLPEEVIAGSAGEGRTGSAASGRIGQFAWSLGSAKAGAYEGRVQVFTPTGWENVGAPFTLRFGAGDPAPANSWLIQPDTPAPLADGISPLVVAARVLDAQSNPAESGTVVFDIPAGLRATFGDKVVDGPGSAPVAVKSGGAAVAITTIRAGDHTVTAQLAGAGELTTVKDAAEATVLRQDGQVFLTFVAGGVAGEVSELSMPTAGAAVTVGSGSTHRAEVLVRDANGNAVAGRAVSFEWTWGTAAAPGSGAWTPVAPVDSDQSGQAVFDLAAPANRAGWVWVRAFVGLAGGGRVAVGAVQTSPVAAAQTTLRAEFAPADVDEALTRASFEAYGAAVLNDAVSRSWARVLVADRHGNAVPGAKVTFALPASVPEAAGTPQFLGGAPGAKVIEVTTCGDLADGGDESAPECLKNGVHTPGLATAWIVSEFEGEFTVSARVDTAGGPVEAGSGSVKFAAGAAAARASWFTLTRTDSSARAVRANGQDSYKLEITVMNGGQGAAWLPVSGACVAPDLPAGLVIKDTRPSGGDCGPGEFASGVDGKVTLAVASNVAGSHPVGASIGGEAVPTEAAGSVHRRQAVFAGGSAAGGASELTSPDGPVRADDPAGQVVTLTIRDSAGNLASCFDAAGDPAGCKAWLTVPAGTWVGAGASKVEGPAVVAAVAGVVDHDAGLGPDAGLARVVYRGLEGSYAVTAKVEGPDGIAADVIVADGVAAVGAPGAAHLTLTDATAPARPAVNPSAGASVSGRVADPDLADAAKGELTAVVKDRDGAVVATCRVAGDGSFACAVVPALADGALARVHVVDAAANVSEAAETVVSTRLPQVPQIDPSDGSEVTGVADTPGDTVVVKDAEGEVLCQTTASADKTWACELKPAASEGDSVTVVVTAPTGQETERPWRVGVPRITVSASDALAGGPQAALGVNFQPGEAVAAWSGPSGAAPSGGSSADAASVMAAGATPAGGAEVGEALADESGRVQFDWAVASEALAGVHTVVLTGPLSGVHTADFNVSSPEAPEPEAPKPEAPRQPAAPPPPAARWLPFTGAANLIGILGIALGLALAGCLLVAARRRQDRPS